MQEPTPPEIMKQEDDPEIASARMKVEANHNDAQDDQMEDGYNNNDNSSNSDEGPNRKRRRSRKGLDKKFECPHEGCGKSYSRAEHLYALTTPPFHPHQVLISQLITILAIDISLITTPSRYTSVIFQSAIGNSSDLICVTGTRNGTQPRAQRSAAGTR